MKYVTWSCPHCGKKFDTTIGGERRYGCPIITCKKCGGQFLSTNIIEPALMVENATKPSRIAFGDILCVIIGGIMLYRGFVNYALGSTGLSIFLFIAGGLLFALGVWAFIERIVKYPKLLQAWQDELEASRERLRDVGYIKTLVRLGYRMPSKYSVIPPVDGKKN